MIRFKQPFMLSVIVAGLTDPGTVAGILPGDGDRNGDLESGQPFLRFQGNL
jgi:hypothetical protein